MTGVRMEGDVVAEAGWFRDPQDPNSEIYFDGQAWTTYRRPVPPAAPVPPQPDVTWNAPAPTPWPAPGPEWGAPAPAAGWAPPPPPRKRGRGRLIAVAAVIVLAAAGLVTWLARPGSDAPKLTYAGKAIDHPERVLTSAESELADYVRSRHGVRNAQTRCYFERPGQPAAGAKKTDVGAHLACGPVLFVDGDPGRPFVRVALDSAPGGRKATLTPPAQLTDLPSQAVPAGVTLTRPDGADAPAGSGGLKAPAPPAGAKDMLASVTLGPTPAPKAVVGARMIGKTDGLELTAAGEIPRYGSGDEARSAPPGERLIAFQVRSTGGDLSVGGTAIATVEVDGAGGRPLPTASGNDEGFVIAVPTSSTATLVLADADFPQSLSLPDGKPGPDNLAVLARTHRQAFTARSLTIKARVSNGTASANLNLHARMHEARVDFWAPGNSAVHAPDGRHALLTTDLTYTDPNQPGDVFGFEPALVRLRLPGGQLLKPRNAARRKNKIYDVFTVPAGFTTGTLLVTGSERVGAYTLRILKTASFPISIAAG